MKRRHYNIVPLIFFPFILFSQEDIKSSIELFPNGSHKSIITPTGSGGYGTHIFGVLAGTYPQTYSINPDLVAAIGLGIGNSYKTVHVVGMLNINDVSSINNFSSTFIISRRIAKGTGASVGCFHFLRNKKISDTKSSLFAAVSHSVQTLPSKTPGVSKLNYTIGIGNGRFYERSLGDILRGKTRNGTAVFANVSYEFITNVNIIAEWTGLNLGTAFSWRPSYKLPVLNLALADLTRNSSNRPGLVFSIAQSFLLNK